MQGKFIGSVEGFLCLNINDLATAVHPVGGVDAVGTEEGSIRRILGQLRCAELVGATAFA